MVVVVDYGMGNLRSVSKAVEALGVPARVTSEPREVAEARKLILPGVGAFGAAMRELSDRGLIEPLKAAIASGTPYLGMCLGLQLLFDSSDESPGVPGLGVLQGTVKRFSRTTHHSPLTCHLKVPHMGWNQVTRGQKSGVRGQKKDCPLLKDIPEGSFFYFVHSYYGEPTDRSVIALETEYGVRFAAMVWRERLFATQFHPEKSQALGLKLLENFLTL
jgi:glutamine amidotransferase